MNCISLKSLTSTIHGHPVSEPEKLAIMPASFTPMWAEAVAELLKLPCIYEVFNEFAGFHRSKLKSFSK